MQIEARRAQGCAYFLCGGLPGASLLAALAGLAGRPGAGSVKLWRRVAGRDVDLLAALQDDSRMAAEVCDVADEGDEFAAQVGDIAYVIAVAAGDGGME